MQQQELTTKRVVTDKFPEARCRNIEDYFDYGIDGYQIISKESGYQILCEPYKTEEEAWYHAYKPIWREFILNLAKENSQQR